ncbi:hypothetical protein N9U05_00445 [bacterium]|nr:hypothetical protein [bacterium]
MVMQQIGDEATLREYGLWHVLHPADNGTPDGSSGKSSNATARPPDIVIGLGSFRSAADFSLSYLCLNLRLHAPKLPMVLWVLDFPTPTASVEGPDAAARCLTEPWGAGVYQLVLLPHQLATIQEHRGAAGCAHGSYDTMPVIQQHEMVVRLPLLDEGAAEGGGVSGAVAVRAVLLVRSFFALLPTTVSLVPESAPTDQVAKHEYTCTNSRVVARGRYNWAIGVLAGPSLFELSESAAHDLHADGYSNDLSTRKHEEMVYEMGNRPDATNSGTP